MACVFHDPMNFDIQWKLAVEAVIYKFKDFLKSRFPYEVRKLPIHTFLGCPHRENRTGKGGCIYCFSPGFSTIDQGHSDIRMQISEGIARARTQGFSGKFIAYFQTGTNTYASIDTLNSQWKTIDDFHEDIIGLSVSTRPDCLSGDVLKLLSNIAERLMVWVELGLQSIHDRSLELIKRGHDYACFKDAVQSVRHYPDLLICAHIILGVPGESDDDMMETFRELNRLKVDGVKIHHLQVVKHTLLADWYNRGSVKVFDEDAYIDLLVRLLPHLSSDIMIHRLIGDIRDDLLIAPKWNLPKTRMIQLIEDGLKEKGVRQGSLLNSYAPG